MGERVVVVGAGPIGMTAALALARQGVPSILLDTAERHSGEGSKAICIQRDVLEVFDRLGVGRAMADEGVSWTLGRTYFRSRELFQTRLPQSRSVFPPFVNLPQSRSEELLFTAVKTCEHIDLRWQHRLVGLADDGDEVELSFQTPTGHETIRAPWVVGCDGGRSAVRKLVGIDFPGHSHPDRFLIADIRADLPFPNERRFFFDPPFNPGRQVLIHPQPDRVWRIDWQVPPETDVEEERRSGRLDQRIRAIVGETPYELIWLSNYKFHQRVADHFRAGRVLLAGDAAHLMSPFGARGMNSGVQDAENLAWKLGLVVAGVAPPALLDTYEEERRAAALENLRVTDETMRFMVPSTSVRKLLRNAVLRASGIPAVRRFVNSGRLATPYDYSESSIVLGQTHGEGGPRPGQVAPDAQTPRGRLRELVGPDFLAVAFTDIPWNPQADPPAPTRILTLPPVEPYLADRWYLVRPDGHLAAGPLSLEKQVGDVVTYCIGRRSLVAL
jgi:3-(3-hydroxy-phenyl)propionate hydroxylase